MKKRFLFFAIACTLAFSSCSSTLVDVPDYVDTSATVTLDSTELNLDIGNIVTLTAYPESESESTKLIWVPGDSTIIDVTINDTEATLVAKSAGDTYVTAIYGASSASCHVIVGGSYSPIKVTSIALDISSKTLDVEENFTLTAEVVATGGTPALTWATGNPSVATVSTQTSKTALVTAKAAGSTMITVAAGGHTAQCEVVVEDPNASLSIRLDKSSLSLVEEATAQLTATTKPEDAVVNWQSDASDVAEVSSSGLVTAKKAGKATISASVSDGTNIKTATCSVAVSGKGKPQTEYPEGLKKAGHLYFHYLRTTDTNYDKWALWIWPNYPHDGEGSLWGANTSFDLKGITPQSVGFMTNAQAGAEGTATDAYLDDNGRVIDVDLTDQTIPGGKSGKISPLVATDVWEDAAMLKKAALGFLVVDQSKMTGEDMWESDGGAETYIKRLGNLISDPTTQCVHVYAVEGNVSEFTTESGKQEFINPTLTDTTGAYVSKNDITNLKADAFKSGVATSTSFLADRPGVGYQIFVPSFCDSDGDGYGDIKGITSKLDYLEDLNVEVLWLTPIQESNSYHGYDVTDYYKIDQRFGTLEDYQELIYKAHEKGMKVLMDMVINHTSKSNVLFKKSQRAETEEINGKTINYRDMYLWKFKGDKILEWNGVEGKYDATNPATFIKKNVEDSDDWYKDGTSDYYYYGKFGSGMAELNYSSQATRDYMTDMCKYWLSFGLDGFRLDAIKHIYLLGELDPSYNYSGDYITYDVGYRTYYNSEMPELDMGYGKGIVRAQNDYSYDRELNVMFWKQFAGTLKSAYPNCFLVGENFDGWDARIAPFYESMDSQFDFSTYYHLNEMKPDSMGSSVNHSLSGGNGDNGYYTYRKDAINGAFTSNHDIARMMNHAAAHDESITQKYAGGDGIHHKEVNSSNLAYTLNQARYYAAITILTPGVSWIYYGDELGLTGNVQDEVKDSSGNVVNDHGNNVDRWYRQPMKWGNELGKDGVVKYGFSGLEVLWDKMNQNLATVSAQEADPNSLLNYFKLLTAAKNDDRYPTYGHLQYFGSIDGGADGTYMKITDGTRTVIVRVNNSDVQAVMGIPEGTLLAGSPGASTTVIPAHGFHVLAV